MTETNGSGPSFNVRVSETNFAGSVIERLDRLEDDSKEMKADLKHLRTIADQFNGVGKFITTASAVLGTVGTALGAMNLFSK